MALQTANCNKSYFLDAFYAGDKKRLFPFWLTFQSLMLLFYDTDFIIISCRDTKKKLNSQQMSRCSFVLLDRLLLSL
jgi:hypothetical protein